MTNTNTPEAALLPIPLSTNSNPELAKLENSVIEFLVKHAVKSDLIQTKEDPREGGRILGVFDNPGAQDRLAAIAQNAQQWVSSGAAKELLDQARQGRAYFIELAQNNPEKAYELVEQTLQLKQVRACSDMQDALSFRQFLGELPSPQERLDADKKALGAVTSYSASVDSQALQRGLAGGEKVLALNTELRQKMATFEAVTFALVDLDSQKNAALELEKLGDKLTKEQLTAVTQASALSLLTLVKTVPEQQEVALDYVAQCVKLELELDQQGRLSPESLKAFSMAHSHLSDNLSRILPSLAASTLEEVKPTVGRLGEIAGQLSQAYLKSMDEQAPLLAHVDGAELASNPYRLGFVAAIAETSQVFDAAKTVGQSLSTSEKVSMMPAVAEILASNQVLNFAEPQSPLTQQTQPKQGISERLGNNQQVQPEGLER